MRSEIMQWVVMPLLAIAIIPTMIRLMQGPSFADRVVAMDQLLLLGLGFISTYALWHNDPILLDVAVLLALIAFLGTVAFARYLEKRSD